MSLKNIKNIVEKLLETKPATRNSDRILYAEVCSEMGWNLDNMTANEMLHNPDMPSTESVRRTRQKAQAENPMLKACEAVEKMRAKLESDYRAFALEGAV